MSADQNEPTFNFQRMSEKRPDRVFITSLLKHPSSRFILFSGLNPLLMPTAKGRPMELAYRTFSEVESVVDPEGRKGQQWIFLGVDKEDVVELEGKEIGRPYFAVDVTMEDDSDLVVKNIVRGGLDWIGLLGNKRKPN